MLAVIKAVYQNRMFRVRDGGRISEPHEQQFGICQGCPLSPFLFVMVMTVLMRDAKRQLLASHLYVDPALFEIQELLYADDTLLVHGEPAAVEVYMSLVSRAGSEHGLSFNWGKLECMPVRCHAEFYTPGGDPVKTTQSMKYLGSMLSSDGKLGTELSYRLGQAKSEFNSLCKIWSHAAIPRKIKLRIFEACVVSKLLYCLNIAWLHKGEIRKLDAFHHRCLRRIAGIQPSYWSRVSNADVLETLQCCPLSQILLEQQLRYIGHVARKPAGHPLRDIIFLPGSVSLRPVTGKRRKGRPRQTWARQLHTMSCEIGGGTENLEGLWENTKYAQSRWDRAVEHYCQNLSKP